LENTIDTIERHIVRVIVDKGMMFFGFCSDTHIAAAAAYYVSDQLTQASQFSSIRKTRIIENVELRNWQTTTAKNQVIDGLSHAAELRRPIQASPSSSQLSLSPAVRDCHSDKYCSYAASKSSFGLGVMPILFRNSDTKVRFPLTSDSSHTTSA